MTERQIISVGNADAVEIAQRLRRSPGVISVIADPVRRQVVIRYRTAQTSWPELRERLLPTPGGSPRLARLLPWWPRLARVTSLLACVA